MKRFEGKVALITGASRGIGRGIALCLAAEGADIVVNYRSHSDEAQEVAGRIRQMGGRSLVYRADVAERDAVAEMFAQAVEHFDRIDIAVANAGINIPGSVLEAEWESALRVFQVSQFGAYHTAQMAARQMVKQAERGHNGGKIILVGSIHEQLPVPGSAAYNMAKAAVGHLARTMALELAPYHINVNVVAPGRIDTPSTRGLLEWELQEEANRHIPWGRMGTPEEIGKAVAYLASDDADYVTGATLVIDGGFSINLDLRVGDSDIWGKEL